MPVKSMEIWIIKKERKCHSQNKKACFCSKHTFYLFHLVVLDLVHRKIFAFSREKQDREVSFCISTGYETKEKCANGNKYKA